MEEIIAFQALSPVSVQSSALEATKEPVRYRAACDRCHGKKIRCQKEPGAKNCNECTKNTIECRFTIFRKEIKRPQTFQRKRKGSVESQLAGLEDRVKAIRESHHLPSAVRDSANKPKPPPSSCESDKLNHIT